MNRKTKEGLRKLSLGVLLPVLLLGLVSLAMEKREATQPLPTMAAGTTAATDPTEGSSREERHLSLLYDGTVLQMELEQYLIGVVLAEMPASFEPEALKAQAVAARTYTILCCQNGSRHGENAICGDPGCCQAYIEPEEYTAAGGSMESVEKVRQAVEETAGFVVVYKGNLIQATYFSCSGGMTEDAVAVWGQEIPYLQAVPSPGEESASVYTETKVFTPDEFQKALGIRLQGSVETWFQGVSHTEGSGVEAMQIGGILFRGTTLRKLLGLRSTNFTVRIQQGMICVTTKGFGHRVGMSQYGANAMAKAGYSFQEILTYYYTGAEVVQY